MVISTINHSDIGAMFTNLDILGASDFGFKDMLGCAIKMLWAESNQSMFS